MASDLFRCSSKLVSPTGQPVGVQGNWASRILLWALSECILRSEVACTELLGVQLGRL